MRDSSWAWCSPRRQVGAGAVDRSSAWRPPTARGSWNCRAGLRVGDTNRQVARELGLSEGAVRNHLLTIYARLDAHSRTEALARAGSLLASSLSSIPAGTAWAGRPDPTSRWFPRCPGRSRSCRRRHGGQDLLVHRAPDHRAVRQPSTDDEMRTLADLLSGISDIGRLAPLLGSSRWIAPADTVLALS